MTQRTLLLATAACALLTLAACERAQQAAPPTTGAPIASLPLAQAAPPPEQVAPYVNQLPAAPPLPRARPRRALYSYVDDAYALGDVFADSPPDYTVAYDGEYPWVWRTGDGAYRVVEEVPDGWREYYYYGDSDYPFLIRDPQYAYAYDGPQLVVIYDSYGRPYPDYSPQLVDYGTRYFFRGRRLYDAAIHQQRRAAYAADWRAHRDEVVGLQQVWATEQARNETWRRVREQRVAAPPPRFDAWRQERAQRVAWAQRNAPMIAAAPAPPREARRPQPNMAFAPPAAGPPAMPPGIAVRDQAIAAARERQAGHAAELQAAQQNRLADQRARDQQRFAAEAQNRQFADQRRQIEPATRDRQQAEAQQVREQQRFAAEARNRQLADQRRQVDVALREQQRTQAEHARQAQQAEAHARDAAGRQQAEQVRMADRAQHDRAVQAERVQADRVRRDQMAEAQRAERTQAQRAQHEQQAMAERVQRQQQAEAAGRAQHGQQAQAMRVQHDQQAQAQREQQANAQRAAEQQQQRQAQAAGQHAQQAAAQVAQRGGGHPHPDKKDKPEK